MALTNRKELSVTFFVVSVVVLAAIVITVPPGALPLPKPLVVVKPEPLPRRCKLIPTEVAGWGLSVQSTPAGLYLCFQQGGPQGMTNVTCTPMGDCPP